jgi:hypothetical protein
MIHPMKNLTTYVNPKSHPPSPSPSVWYGLEKTLVPTVLVSPQPCMNPVSEKFDVCCNKVESAAALIPGAGGLPATQGLATLARQVGRQIMSSLHNNFSVSFKTFSYHIQKASCLICFYNPVFKFIVLRHSLA